MKTLARIAAATCLLALPSMAFSWTLEADTSTVAFGSIKNDFAGEAHSFGSISGDVGADGQVTVDIQLASVDTRIDIRNERMLEHIFGDAATATVSAEIDMAVLEGLKPGESMVMEVDATLDLLGTETPFFLDMFVMRLSEDRVMASSNAPAYLATEDLGIDAGIDVLQRLASLDSITRVVPITARLIFMK